MWNTIGTYIGIAKLVKQNVFWHCICLVVFSEQSTILKGGPGTQPLTLLKHFRYRSVHFEVFLNFKQSQNISRTMFGDSLVIQFSSNLNSMVTCIILNMYSACWVMSRITLGHGTPNNWSYGVKEYGELYLFQRKFGAVLIWSILRQF